MKHITDMLPDFTATGCKYSMEQGSFLGSFSIKYIPDLEFILQKWIKNSHSYPFLSLPHVTICPGNPLIMIEKEVTEDEAQGRAGRGPLMAPER